MKSILLSIKPKYVSMILNGEKTIEIRKRFPKDYVGWVYIYCSKNKLFTLRNERYVTIENEKYHIDSPILSGKVVARFWCDKAEEIQDHWITQDICQTNDMSCVELEQKSCLHSYDIHKYLQNKIGYACHITKLEIFDKPKELTSFFVKSHKVKGIDRNGKDKDFIVLKPLTKPFQSWGYIEDGQG